ncbi:MAG: DUF917 domain-containing protein [Myxococcota bacterium]
MIDNLRSKLVLSEADLHDFARGAAFLGTGGGGDPYLGRLLCQAALQEYGHPQIVGLDQLPDDAMVAFVAMLGAPTVLLEKGVSGLDVDLALQRLQERLGRPVDALMSAEIGGLNSTLPIVAAARAGLPLVDADGMGRAFPELQMVVMNFEGVSSTPFVMVDEHLNSIIVDTHSAVRTEQFVRLAAMQMGLSCVVAGYPLTVDRARTATIPNTMTEALRLGRAIAAGRSSGRPSEALIEALSSSSVYGYALEVFEGKIADLRRTTEGGFNVGYATLESSRGSSRTLEIIFQNENLVARENGELRAIVPDLITVVDQENAEPIPTESLRYGQRVKVIAAAAPAPLTTPRALEFIHPRCFGLDEEYIPLEELARRAQASRDSTE